MSENSTAEVLYSSTIVTPFLCPDIECDSPECDHLERSGLCEDVINGSLEMTRENCGCCILCKDDIGEFFNEFYET